MPSLEELFAVRLRELAAARGIPLSHLADRAGLARSYMWLLLEARSSATLAVLQRIADALEVEPLVLLANGAYPITAPELARVAERGKPREKRATRRARTDTRPRTTKTPKKTKARRG